MGMIAGKVMPRPMGPYNASTVYSILDIVSHDNKTWIAKKSNLQGVTPSTSNSASWMLAVASADTTEIAAIQEEISELKNSVSDGKTLVANAITGKGITTATTATFSTMATNIEAIDTLSNGTADATATAANILSGKTAYAKGAKVTGSMTNRGAVSQALNAGGSYTIPAGYHNGSGKVTANSLASQTSGTATAADIALGKTAFVNGVELTGESYRRKVVIDNFTLIEKTALATEFPNCEVRSARLYKSASATSSGLDMFSVFFKIDIGLDNAKFVNVTFVKNGGNEVGNHTVYNDARGGIAHDYVVTAPSNPPHAYTLYNKSQSLFVPLFKGNYVYIVLPFWYSSETMDSMMTEVYY